MNKVKFPKRVVLGVGYPWGVGNYNEQDGTSTCVGMAKRQHGIILEECQWPKVLWRSDVPQYRIVLERVR